MKSACYIWSMISCYIRVTWGSSAKNRKIQIKYNKYVNTGNYLCMNIFVKYVKNYKINVLFILFYYKDIYVNIYTIWNLHLCLIIKFSINYRLPYSLYYKYIRNIFGISLCSILGLLTPVVFNPSLIIIIITWIIMFYAGCIHVCLYVRETYT